VHPLFEFRLPPESCLASPSPPAVADELLSWALLPFSTRGIGSPLPRELPVPATVRPQGLITLSAAYAFRAPAGFVAHRRRSWDLPFGAFSSRKVSAAFRGGRTHIPFLSSVIPPPKRRAGPTSRGFWALTLPGVPGDRRGISAPGAGCSLGFHPLRACGRKPGPGLHPGSSHALRTVRPKAAGTGASESRSTSAWSRPVIRQAEWRSEKALTGFSHRHVPERSNEAPPGL